MKKLISFFLLVSALDTVAQNPVLLKDVFPGNNTGTIQQIVKTVNYTFFNEDDNDPDNYPSLFRTDGTTAGTMKLDLTYPGYISSKATLLTALGNKVIFAGDNFAPGYGEIWVSDGTQAGTIALERFQPTISNNGPVYAMAEMNGYVYYGVVAGNNKTQIRRTDGTAGGTSLVYEFTSYTTAPVPALFKVINGVLYFDMYDQYGAGNDMIWRSDGTTAGTYMLRDLGTEYFAMGYFMGVGNNICFMTGKFSNSGSTLFVTDGTPSGTVPMYDFNSNYSNNLYPSFASVGNTLYFAANNGINGKELWKTDGTAAGTSMAADINPGAGGSNPLGLTALNNVLYFSAANPTYGGELWKFSNNVASLVKDINPGTASSGPGGLTVSGNTIIFNATNGVNGGELWITDGTTMNTVMVADINPGAGNSVPNTFTGGDPVYFAANNGTSGFEVYKYTNNGEVLAGPHKFYVNDNSQTGDVFTTGTGSNNNNGSKAFPFATISYAVTQVQPGDSIIVDAGTYTEQVTLDKSLVIVGAGMNATSILKPAVTVAPPGSFSEQGVIQTAQSITGDVHLRDLSVTGDYNTGVTPVVLQTGGSIKDCKFQNGNQGVFVRIDNTINPGTKVAYLENNIIQAEYIGVNYAGINLQGSLINNSITVANPGFSAGAFIGQDFGSLSQFTATGNSFANYVSSGITLNSNTSVINNNSFTGNGTAIQRTGGTNTPNATCNWYGTNDETIIRSKISGTINYVPWLVDGTDTSPATGFQPAPGICTGHNRLYVNDNSQLGDVFTTAVGNDGNPGTAAAPFATLSKAYTTAQSGDSIYMDAGTYNNIGGTIGKSLTILGANYQVSPNDAANALLPNAGRNAETIITNSTFTIGANDINLSGFTLDPGARIQLQLTNTAATNNDFSNIKVARNRFLISNTLNAISITGKFVALPVTGNYIIDDNRFEKNGGASGTSVQLNYLNNVSVTNNAFVLAAPAFATLQTAIGIGSTTTGKVDNLLIDNNVFDRPNAPVNTVKFGTVTISSNKSYNGRLGLTLSNNVTEPAVITVKNNLITNVQSNPAIFFSRSNATDNSGINRFICEGNTISLDGTGLISSSSIMIASSFSTVVPLTTNMETIVKKNQLNFTGDFSSATNVFSITGLRFAGRHTGIQADSNEVTLNVSGIPAAVLSNITGILVFSNPGNLNNSIPPNAVINIQNNKVNGFKQSLVFNDAINNGYGGLASGTVANISNNSFTNDSISINNGTTSQSVSANCNWYGSAAAQNVIQKITPLTVTVSPWLNNGTDNDPAIGFQPVAGSCNGTSVSVSLVQAVNINCHGDNSGSIDVSATGGVQPYSFTWTKQGDAGFNANSEDLSNITAGTYNLLVTDANGSTASIDVTLTEPAASMFITWGITNVSCYGGSNGSLTASLSGGTPPYTYTWNNGATTSTINNLQAGQYMVLVHDANNCAASSGNFVTQPAAPLTVTMSGTTASCNGSATATPAGGTSPYTYAWNNGATTQVISNVPAGVYAVTVTDAHNCTVNGSYTITGNSPINPAASVVNASCYGTATGIITVTSAGGVAPRSYNINGSAWQTSNIFNNLAAGTYLIGVKDANGCSDFVSKTVSQPTQLIVVLDNTVRPCGSSNNGRIFITASGGTGAKTYFWTGPNGYTSTVQDPNNLYAGLYNLTVTDAKGCTATLTVNLQPYPQITITELVTNVSCRGGSNGAIDATITGGSGAGFTYRWTLPGGFFVTTEDISNLTAANYTLLVTDNDNGCSITKVITITQPAANLNLSVTKTNVTGCTSMGTITATASGGTAPYQYSLDGTNYQGSGLFVNVAGGIYTVYVKDANGCTNTKQTTVIDNGTDQYESNNSKNQSKLINVGENIYARIALATDPADWFKFTTTDAGNYSVTLTHPSINYVLNLYTASNTTALVPVNTTSNTKEYLLAANTQYFISITGGLSYTCYNLSVYPSASANKTNLEKTGAAGKEPVLSDLLSSRVYPNPHQGHFTLQINSPESNMATIQLMTAEGKVILTTKKMLVKGNDNNISFDNIRDVILFYRVILGKQTVSGKVIRQN